MHRKQREKEKFVYVSALQNQFQMPPHSSTVHTTLMKKEAPTLHIAERQVLHSMGLTSNHGIKL